MRTGYFYWHSKDDGKAWDKPVKLWPEDGRAVYQTEVSVLNGEVIVFLTLHNGGFCDWECVMMKSADNGYTWENAGTPPCFSRYVFFRGMIQTADGGLVMAYQIKYRFSGAGTKYIGCSFPLIGVY